MHQQGIKKTIPPFDIKVSDIVANRGCKEEQWFQWYSRKVGGRYTPVIMIDGVGFYLWGGDKPSKLEKDQLSRTDKLKSEVIAELTETVFEKETPLFDKMLMYVDRGIRI